MNAALAHNTVAAVAAATVVAGGWAAPASAAQSRVRTVCARQSRVLSTPGGLVVGFLAHRAPVIVLERTRNRYWTEVRAVHSIVGWVHSRDLC